MKILLAVDGSYSSFAAVRQVASRPWPPGSVVRIVYVCESSSEPMDVDPARLRSPFPPPPHPIGKALAHFEGGPMKVEAKILAGRPKAAILDEARAWEADLVVVGSHGMSGVERFLLGSVSLAVASHAHCSVEIVRPKEPRQPSQ